MVTWWLRDKTGITEPGAWRLIVKHKNMLAYENTSVFVPANKNIVNELNMFGDDGWRTTAVIKMAKAKGQEAGWIAFFCKDRDQA